MQPVDGVRWAEGSNGGRGKLAHTYSTSSSTYIFFSRLPCLHVYSYYASSWGSVPRPRTVPSHDNVSTRPLKPSWPWRLSSARRFSAWNPLRHSFQTASTRPRARICGRTYGTAFPRRATQPAGRTSNAPSSASMASVRAWWRRRACRGCERKRTATNRVAPHSSRPMRTAGTCLKGPATISTKHTMPSMPRSRFLPAAGASRSWRSSRNAPSAR